MVTDIIGYTFQADNHCPDCLVDRLIRYGILAPAAVDMRVEDTLDQAWETFGVFATADGATREDESSFDSGTFPKVILAVQAEGDERCGDCGRKLRP